MDGCRGVAIEALDRFWFLDREHKLSHGSIKRKCEASKEISKQSKKYEQMQEWKNWTCLKEETVITVHIHTVCFSGEDNTVLGMRQKVIANTPIYKMQASLGKYFIWKANSYSTTPKRLWDHHHFKNRLCKCVRNGIHRGDPDFSLEINGINPPSLFYTHSLRFQIDLIGKM